jgi:Flp pilus assembly protein TadG
MRNQRLFSPSVGRHKGATAVEFALIATILFTMLFGMIEASRVLFLINTASEATRQGARLAAVCDVSDSAVAAKVSEFSMIPSVTAGSVTVSYDPNPCIRGTCQTVTVSMPSVSIQTVIPFVPFDVNLPASSTTLPVESLTSVWPDASSGATNPDCT